MQLSVTVVPKSGRFEIKEKNGKIKIYLKSAPESNKANLELIRGLGKILKCKVSIVSGLTSRKKILEIPSDCKHLKFLIGEKQQITPRAEE